MAHQHLLTNFVLLSLFLAYLLWGQNLLLAWQQTKSAAPTQPQSLRIGPQGVDVGNAQEQAIRTWQDIPDIGSDREHIYLYLTKATALVVPRRAFLNLQQAQEFETQARLFRDSPPLVATQPNAADSTEGADNSVWPPRPVFRAAPAPLPATAALPNPEDAPGAVVLPYITTKADLLRSQWFFLPRRPASWAGVLIPYTLAAGTWTVPRLPLLPALLWAVAIAALATLLTVAVVTYNSLRVRFAQHPQGRPCRTVASPETLCDITPEGRRLYPWQNVTSIQMSRGDIYVLSGKTGGMVVPRTAFANPRLAAEYVGTLRGFWQQHKTASLVPAAPQTLPR